MGNSLVDWVQQSSENWLLFTSWPEGESNRSPTIFKNPLTMCFGMKTHILFPLIRRAEKSSFFEWPKIKGSKVFLTFQYGIHTDGGEKGGVVGYNFR